MEETATPSGEKRSIGIKYGLISVVAGLVYFFVLKFAGQNPLTFKWGWIVQLLMTATIIFLAHKEYKEDNDGFMTYGEGMVIVLWYTLIGVGVGLLFQYIYLTFLDATVMQEFYEMQYDNLQKQGLSDEQIEVGLTWTRKLYWFAGIFFASFFSVVTGLVVTIFTQKRPPEQRF